MASHLDMQLRTYRYAATLKVYKAIMLAPRNTLDRLPPALELVSCRYHEKAASLSWYLAQMAH